MSLECPWADHHITVTSTGNISTCCMSVPVIDPGSGQPYNIKTHTISQAFNSKEFNNIRENLHNGIKDTNCDFCWKKEEDVGRSLRLETIDRYKEVYDSGKNTGLLTLQLNLSNQCNLKCRTCNASDSSMWIKEQYDFQKNSADISLIDFQKKYNFTLHKETDFLEDLKTNVIPNIVVIRFQGGEPFLIKRQWDIIDSILELGLEKDILLSYHTNATIWNDEIAKKLSNFKEVNICLSIDDIGKKFEYLRHPGRWDEVEDNINRIIQWCREFPDSRDVMINTVVTPYNLYTVENILEYFIIKDVPVELHPTDEPAHFSISNIPESTKPLFLNKLLYKKFPQQYQGEIDHVVSRLLQSGSPEQWEVFLKTTQWHDEYRNENYKQTFPEFYEIINQHVK
jgi:MoaA/NifB/PqqE/SkfB family radical SAM enzyme